MLIEIIETGEHSSELIIPVSFYFRKYQIQPLVELFGGIVDGCIF